MRVNNIDIDDLKAILAWNGISLREYEYIKDYKGRKNTFIVNVLSARYMLFDSAFCKANLYYEVERGFESEFTVFLIERRKRI